MAENQNNFNKDQLLNQVVDKYKESKHKSFLSHNRAGNKETEKSTLVESESKGCTKFLNSSSNVSSAETTLSNSDIKSIEMSQKQISTQKRSRNCNLTSIDCVANFNSSNFLSPRNKSWRKQKPSGVNKTAPKKRKRRNANLLCKVKYNFGYLFDVTYLRNGTELKYSSEESSAIAIRELQKRFNKINPLIKVSKNYVCPHMKYDNKNVCFISDRQTALKEHLLIHGDCYYQCPKCKLKIGEKKTGLQHCFNVCKVIKNHNELSQFFVVDVNPKILENYKKHDPHKHKAINSTELQVALLSVKRKNGFPLPLNNDGSINTSILKSFIAVVETPQSFVSKIETLNVEQNLPIAKNLKENATTAIAPVIFQHSIDDNNFPAVQSMASKKVVEQQFSIPSLKQISNSNSKLYNPNKILTLPRIVGLNRQHFSKSQKKNGFIRQLPSLKFLLGSNFYLVPDSREMIQPQTVFHESFRNSKGMELLLKATECLEYEFNFKKVMFVNYPYVAARTFRERDYQNISSESNI